MVVAWLAFLCALLIQLSSAGPIQRNIDVVRRANPPARRFRALSEPISFRLLHGRATGAVEVVPISSEPTTSILPGKAKEDGKVPAVGVGAGNTSLLDLLSSTLSLAPVSSSSPASSPLQSTVSVVSNSSTPTATLLSSSTISSSAISSPALTEAATPTRSKQVGKVPAVGVGVGNTSLLAVLSSAIDAASLLPTSTSTDGAPTTKSTVETIASASSSSPAKSCTNTTSTAATLVSPSVIPAAQTLSSTGSVTSTERAAQISGTTLVPIPAPESPGQSSSVNPTPPADTPGSTTTGTPVPGTTSPSQSTSGVALPVIVSPSISAGGTVTLRISTTVMTTLSENGPQTTETPLAVSLTSPNSLSSQSAEIVTLRQSTTMTTTVESAPGLAPGSETSLSPVPLASTTVTPLVSAPNLATVNTAATPTPTPFVSMQAPAGSQQGTLSAEVPLPTGSSPDLTIPLGDFTIVLHSAPVPASSAAGNTVIPIMGSFLTVTVTTTVTAK